METKERWVVAFHSEMQLHSAIADSEEDAMKMSEAFKEFGPHPLCDWFSELVGFEAMKFQEEVCRFIREKLILKNIKVDVRTYID